MSKTKSKQRTVWGTCYFPTYMQAYNYYEAYESDPAKAVLNKLDAGEIHIGKPEAKPGERLFITDNRWHVETWS